MSMRVFAIDWSGRKVRAQKNIWLAEVDCATKRVLQLCNGRDRSAIQRYLIAEAERAPNFVVGLDFAFSFPAWRTGGAGAVGTGSIRGMPMLLQLRNAGFAIWPFDSGALP